MPEKALELVLAVPQTRIDGGLDIGTHCRDDVRTG
jgi:hypothetical protein